MCVSCIKGKGMLSELCTVEVTMRVSVLCLGLLRITVSQEIISWTGFGSQLCIVFAGNCGMHPLCESADQFDSLFFIYFIYYFSGKKYQLGSASKKW